MAWELSDAVEVFDNDLGGQGEYACARRRGGQVRWGGNARGQLGDGTTRPPHDTPGRWSAPLSVPSIRNERHARRRYGRRVPRELEQAVLTRVRAVYGGKERSTPDWLQRPGPAECGNRWALVCRLYAELTDMELPEIMPPRERRTVDCVLQRSGERPRIVEFDESQHFNRYRAQILRGYPRRVSVAYDRAWLAASDAKRRLEGGGFGKPKPPLFLHEDGPHRQRTFRDALADLCPPSTADCRRCGSPL